MRVATEPYGNKDFDYPAVGLKPFKASKTVIITQDEAQKAFEEEENKNAEESETTTDEDMTDVSEEVVVEPVVKSRFSKDKQKDKKEKAEDNEVKEDLPKVEVKPVKIELPANNTEPKLAPVPMAKPF